MKITSIRIAQLKIPLIRPFITAVRRTENVNDVVVMIKTDSGHTGYGSAASTPLITGDNETTIITAIRDVLAPQLIGQDLNAFRYLLQINQSALLKNTSAKAAIDIALHDLFAQHCGVPLYQLLGGGRRQIRTCVTISVKSIEEMVADAITMVHASFQIIKIKIGLNPVEDIERVKAIRQAVGDEVTLLVDANQGYKREDALRVIQALQEYRVEMIEQPVKAEDWDSLNYLCKQDVNFIVADEACFSPKDALHIAQHHACDGINIKLMKSAGLENAEAIYQIAKTANIRLMVGCMLESPIGVAAIASFALSKPDILYADLDPIVLIRENYVMGGAQWVGNEIVLSDKPGLGIEGFSQGLTFVCDVN